MLFIIIIFTCYFQREATATVFCRSIVAELAGTSSKERSQMRGILPASSYGLGGEYVCMCACVCVCVLFVSLFFAGCPFWGWLNEEHHQVAFGCFDTCPFLLEWFCTTPKPPF